MAKEMEMFAGWMGEQRKRDDPLNQAPNRHPQRQVGCGRGRGRRRGWMDAQSKARHTSQAFEARLSALWRSVGQQKMDAESSSVHSGRLNFDTCIAFLFSSAILVSTQALYTQISSQQKRVPLAPQVLHWCFGVHPAMTSCCRHLPTQT